MYIERLAFATSCTNATAVRGLVGITMHELGPYLGFDDPSGSYEHQESCVSRAPEEGGENDTSLCEHERQEVYLVWFGRTESVDWTEPMLEYMPQITGLGELAEGETATYTLDYNTGDGETPIPATWTAALPGTVLSQSNTSAQVKMGQPSATFTLQVEADPAENVVWPWPERYKEIQGPPPPPDSITSVEILADYEGDPDDHRIKPNQSICHWYAEVEGGSLPITYKWYVNDRLKGTSHYYMARPPKYDFDLRVEATNGAGMMSDTVRVDVTKNGQTCLM